MLGRKKVLAQKFSIFDTDQTNLFALHENMVQTPVLSKRASTYSHNSIFEGQHDFHLDCSPVRFADQSRFELHLPKR